LFLHIPVFYLEPEKVVEEDPILENQLSMAVQVLISKSCSEEGLEDATNLLLQLSFANTATRLSVLKLLLAGARELGLTVCSHIRFVNALILTMVNLRKGRVFCSRNCTNLDFIFIAV
jgi:hypothetical protein